MKISIVAVIIVMFLTGVASADTITVGPGAGYDFDNIQAAIDDSNDGDIIIVAPGTYTGPGNRDIDFLGKAITVRSTDPNDPNIVATTVIDCNGTKTDEHHGFIFHRGEDSNSVVEGLTVTGGYYWRGGGIDCRWHSNPTISKCIISRNSAINGGGGLATWYSSPRITHCTFSGNLVTFGGGGIDCIDDSSPTIINCTISGNSAMYGGGISCVKSSPTISNCLISSNSAWLGGGIECVKSNVTIANCTISGNLAERGGGVYFTVPDIWTLSTSSIEDSKPTLTNCTITGNSASYSGGAISFWYHGTANITNCILWDNKAYYGCQISLEDDSSTFLNYTDIQGGQDALYIEPGSTLDFGLGNIDDNPGFVEPGYWDANGVWVEGDYHLLRTSPCVDAGTDANNYSDIEGNARPFDFPGVDNNGELPEFDMGAYELVPVEAKMQLTPQMLNCSGKGKWVKAHITLPKGILPEDVDVNEPAIAYPMEAESEYITVLGGDKGPVRLEVVFGREAFCDSITDDYLDVTVIGSLTTGDYFQGTDTIKVTNKGRGRR